MSRIMKKEITKNLKAYESDIKQINHICVDTDANQADVIRKLLQEYLKKR